MSTSKPFKVPPPLGPGLSGAGGALLTFMFFMPWFSACEKTVTGAEVTLGTDQLQASVWVGLLLVTAVTTLLVAGLSLFISAEGWVRRRPFTLLGEGVTATLLVVGVWQSFIYTTANSNNDGVRHATIEYGFWGICAGAALILAGGVLDAVLVWAPSPQPQSRAPAPAPMRPAPAAPLPREVPIPPPLPVSIPASPPPRVNAAILRGTQGVLAGKSIKVSGDNITIGRSSENQVHVPDSQASRRHAVIRYALGRYYLQDQQSTSGTLLNDQPVTASVLSDGDRITIGETTLEFSRIE